MLYLVLWYIIFIEMDMIIKMLNKKKYGFYLAQLTVLIFLTPIHSFGQLGTASHTITVNVLPISLLQLNVGVVNLNITGAEAVAGVDEMMVTDQTTTLLWGTNSSLQKITVNTSLTTPLFVLKVVALNPTIGMAESEVTLSGIDQNFIYNIGKSSGGCSIKYTGVALASQGTGNDSHSITFTIVAQN